MVKEVREHDDRGRHATQHREMIPLPGGALALPPPRQCASFNSGTSRKDGINKKSDFPLLTLIKIVMKRGPAQSLKKLIALSAAVALIGLYALSSRAITSVHAKISPGPPLSFTGAPGEGTCVGCHYTYGQPNPPASGGKVEITGLPATYAPGQTYTLTVTVSHPTARAWGFEMTAIDAAGTSSTSGTMTAVNSTTTLKRDSSASGKTRTYFSHNDEAGIAKGRSGSNSWSIGWTAPAASAGDITFYAAGNAANNQVTPEDDYIYTTSVVVRSQSNPNSAPVFAAMPDRFPGVGDRIVFTVSATDPDNQPVTITAGALANSTFDPATRRFSFTPAANQIGPQQVTFTASDGQLQSQQTVRFQVLGETSQSLTGLSKPSGPSNYLDFAGATTIELTAAGTFPAGSALLFNGLPVTTQAVTGGLFAMIPAGELGNAGAFAVRVRLNDNTLTNSRHLALASSVSSQAAATVDAASYGTATAAGQIVALFGTGLVQGTGTAAANSLPLPRSLQGASVYVNGVAAPLYFAAGNQINYQMPYSTTDGAAAVTALRDDGVASRGTANIASVAPALFSADASGKGQAVAQNLDFSRNGDPAVSPQSKRARKGEFVILYGSGVGSQFINANNSNTQPVTMKDGEAATDNPLPATVVSPEVTVGGKFATVHFSGLAPGFVSLWQLNVAVPSDAPSGAAVEVVVNFGGKTANRLTIAIE
jgi:uncharacterized protein (TIGR03437 family)